MLEGLDSIMIGAFLEKLKEFLNAYGVQWDTIEHRVVQMDNKLDAGNKEKGYIEIRYLVRIPYTPEVTNEKDETKKE